MSVRWTPPVDFRPRTDGGADMTYRDLPRQPKPGAFWPVVTGQAVIFAFIAAVTWVVATFIAK